MPGRSPIEKDPKVSKLDTDNRKTAILEQKPSLTTRCDINCLEDIISLMQMSRFHRNYTVDDLNRLILPPIRLQQAWVFYRSEKTVGFLSWAYLASEAEAGFANRSRKLRAEDWSAGNRLWYIDLIAPYGDLKNIVTLARRRGFSKWSGSFLRASSGRSIRRKHILPIED